MSTWIAHLRIAEGMLEHLPQLDATAFTFGNLSPDSGVPNADWTAFDPPKTVTHFLEADSSGEDTIRDLIFYHQYLRDVSFEGAHAQYSWLLGYFFHLLSDKLWDRRVWTTTKTFIVPQVEAKGENAATQIKFDWYGLDLRYVRDNPNSLFWRLYYPSTNSPSYLPFIPEAALHQQYDYIRDFYSRPHPTWTLDWVYPYLNETTMTRHVEDTIAALLRIHEAVEADMVPKIEAKTALVLLTEDELAPYSMPLGDV